MPFIDEAVFWKGAVGGERGCAAAESNFRFAVEMAAAFEDGEKRKTRKPSDNKPARTNVIGFVRRIALGMAIVPDVEAVLR